MFQIVGIFASRDDVNEVIEYATAIGKANGDPSGTMTSVMMMYNTTAKLANARIAELEDRIVTAAATSANQRVEDTGIDNHTAAHDELMYLGMLHDGTTDNDQRLIDLVLTRMTDIDQDQWEGY